MQISYAHSECASVLELTPQRGIHPSGPVVRVPPFGCAACGATRVVLWCGL